MRKVKLNNGIEIPQLGIGGFDQGAKEIITAIHLGYRLIDTAAQYGNEEQIGEAIKNCGIKREEIFLSTKLWTEDIRQKRTRDAFFESLRRLKVDYVDMYLIHWPADGFVDAWMEMEKLYKEGYVRTIGLSNCHSKHIQQIGQVANISPSVNQIESHPKFRNEELIDYCRKRAMRIEAWCPLGGPYGRVLEEPCIIEISKKYKKTPAQIVLRWHMQRGIITFPKSAHTDRMRSNIDVFDFNLSEQEMETLNSIDTGHRLGADPENFDF